MTTDWRKRLVARMTELELTPAELSRRADVGSTMIHDILKRGSTPSVHNLRKIIKALGWTFDNLFEGTSPEGLELTIDYALMGGEKYIY